MLTVMQLEEETSLQFAMKAREYSQQCISVSRRTNL